MTTQSDSAAVEGVSTVVTGGADDVDSDTLATEGVTTEGDAAAASADEGGAEGGAEGSTDDSTAGVADDATEAPENYADFSVPEGTTLDAELLNAATPIFKDLGLTQEQAQKLVDFQAQQIEASGQKQADAFNQQLNDWLAESKADPEFGGDDFDKNVSVAAGAVTAYGTPEFKQLLDNTGIP